MAARKGVLRRVFGGIWNLLNATRRLLLNVLFFGLIIGVIVGLTSADDGMVTIENGSALRLDLRGDIVIQKTPIDPIEAFTQEAFNQEPDAPEILITDLVKVIENAKVDSRIELLVLELENLRSAGLDKLRVVANALEDFKTSGKPVIAIGDYYSQSQYYLAAHADEVYLNPMGALLFDGFGTYPLYMASALEKIKATTHVFRVGQYKSAVEPYLRDDMSDASKQNTRLWLDELWHGYKTDVAEARSLPIEQFDDTLNSLLEKFTRVDGNYGNYALENGWVDGLLTRQQARQRIRTLLNQPEPLELNQVSFRAYNKLINPPLPEFQHDRSTIGIVAARGTITDGAGSDGDIGGDTTAELLRQARQDDAIEAVVLHINSPGGSAFASEIVRQEIELLKRADKPVVAVMSSVAASGGYWIAASADEIIAAPTTLTGSIGIFGLFFTFEDTLAELGLTIDGIGTTELNGFNAGRELDERIANLLQMNVENGYQTFIGLVAEQRGMTLAEVDSVAQGQVWTGAKAIDLGLVDSLGYLEDGISRAAELAELTDFETKVIQQPTSPQDQLIRQLLGTTAQLVKPLGISVKPTELSQILSMVDSKLEEWRAFNDPMGTYAVCLECLPFE